MPQYDGRRLDVRCFQLIDGVVHRLQVIARACAEEFSKSILRNRAQGVLIKIR